MGMVGDAKPVAFVEDTAVAPDRLPEFYDRFQAIVARHGVAGRLLRPRRRRLPAHPADHQRQDRARASRPLRSIAREVSDLVVEFGGAMSGEHGDGLARSLWNAQAVRPRGLRRVRGGQARLRPREPAQPRQGRRHAPTPATTSGSAPTTTPASPTRRVFDFSGQGGFARAVEMCSGVGACRKTGDRHDVPELHGHPRRDAHDPRPRQRPPAGHDRRARRDGRPGQRDPRTRPSTSASSARRARPSARRTSTWPSSRPRSSTSTTRAGPCPLGHAADGPHPPAQPDRLGDRPAGQLRRCGNPPFKWLLEKVAGHRPPADPADLRPRPPPQLVPPAPARPPRRARAGRSSCSTTASRPTTTPRSAVAAVRVLEAAGYRVELAGLRLLRPAGDLQGAPDARPRPGRARTSRRLVAARRAGACRSSAASRAAC